MEIINCKYDRINNKSSFTLSINNQNYILSFSSNPLLEVEIINLHRKSINDLYILFEKIIKNEEYDYHTLKNLKEFFKIINK